jgi:hypothetical protein
MPRDDSLTPADLIGKLEILRVECAKCDRRGRYRVDRLVRELGRDGKLTDWFARIMTDCRRKIANNYSDACGVNSPDFPWTKIKLSMTP